MNINDALNIANKTIGLELSPCKSNQSYEDMCRQRAKAISDLKRTPNDDEHIEVGVDILTGEYAANIMKNKLQIDDSKDWKSYLSEKDYDNLAKHGLSKDVLESWNGSIGIGDYDDNILIISTHRTLWRSLCGREWHYNISEGKLSLYAMS